MTPKEKAAELIVKYLRIENTNDWWSKVPAKECALIMVNEILCNSTFMLSNGELYYWNEVKKEIEQL